MKTKLNYSIGQICEDVADEWRGFKYDPAGVRQSINDHADARSKDGFNVRFNFSQDAAVRRVVKSLSRR